MEDIVHGFCFPFCGEKMVRIYIIGVHPGRLTWNLRIHPGKGETSSKPSFSGSMLILGGVVDLK